MPFELGVEFKRTQTRATTKTQLSTDDKQLYLDAAAKIAELGKDFAKRDGNKLKEIDGLDLLPEGPFRGVFQP